MNRRTVPVVAMVAALAVTAFLLGSVSPASARDLTYRAVARIAAKVVEKKAPTLRVAYAQTAGDAATLTGSTADSLRTHVRQYSLSNSSLSRSGGQTAGVTPSPSLEFTFPGLTPGRYLVSYAVRVQFGEAGASAGCGLADNTGRTYGDSSMIVTDTYGTCAATTAMTVPSSEIVFRISYSYPATMRIYEGGAPGQENATVTFTRIDSLTSTAVQNVTAPAGPTPPASR